MLDTSLEQYVGRLSHDRTTERHWQRLGSHRATVPKEVPCGSSTTAAARATSPRAVAVRLSSVPSLGGGDQARAGDPRWVHSCPVWRVVGTVGQPRRRGNGVGVLDDWGWSDPGTLLGVRSPPLSEGRPLLAVSGSSRGWPAHVSSSHTWEARMWSCHCGGAEDRGLFAPQSSHLRGPRGSRGHTCRTPPWACSVSSQSGATRK